MNNTLQTRINGDEGDMKLVARPDRAPDEAGEELSSGEVIPGKILYEDTVRRITYVGMDEENHAFVRVELIEENE